MANEKIKFTSRLANAGLMVRAAVSEMMGRDDPMVGNGIGTIGQIKARFQGYKEISTFDISRTSYGFARSIFYANIYKDRKTGKEYGKDYLLGAPFGKPIVNIAAGFAVGSPVQITESGEITEDDDKIDDDQDNPVDEDGNPTVDKVETNSTISNTNRMLQDRRDIIFKAVRNSYRDGDFFVVVEDDGEFTLLPPEDVDIIVNPNNPDAIDGYDVFSTFPDPADPSGAKMLMYVDEIRRVYRRRCLIDRAGKRQVVTGTEIEYRNLEDGGLEERELPIVHFANEQEARSLYGTSEFQNLYFLMANYHEVLSAAIKGNIYNSTAVPVIQGVKNMKQFLQQNFTQDKDGNYILKWDNQKMLVVGEGGSVQILQANGTATDAQTLLNILFWLISQSSETPEFAFGTAVQSSKASVSEQTPMLIKKAVRKQGELEAPIRKLIELYITRMAIIVPEEFDAEVEFTITMPNILDEDLNINIQIVNALLEKGIITEETAMTMLNLGKYVKNFEEERKRAQQQKSERSPMPTDVFGQPLTDKNTEDFNRKKAKATLNDAKQAEIEEMLKHKDTKSVAEMLSKNIDALTLEQIQEMNPHRGSEDKDPKVVQETKAISVKSGNPYRDGSGRFGSGKSIAGEDAKEEERRRRRRERRQARKAKALAAASSSSDRLDYTSLEQAAERHKSSLSKAASTSNNTEAKRMQAFAKELGYDGKATPISKESKGDIEIYRGWAKESYASEYLSGKSLRLSDGLEGSGQYFAASKYGAERYIQFTGGHLSKQFISKGAKIISADDITNQRWKFSENISKTLQSQREFIRDLPKSKQSSALSRFKQTEKFIVWLTTDNGAFAAYLGYQAIDVKLRGDYLVLDRSIIRYIKD